MYGKHFESMYTGSMFGQGPMVFAIWGYVISHARQGSVELNPRLLAAVIGADEEDVAETIDFLCQADPKSRSQEEEGRRMIRDGEYQYRVVNHKSYNEIRDDEARREYNRIKKQESRARIRAEEASHVKQSVNDGQQMSAHTESDAPPSPTPSPGSKKGKKQPFAKMDLIPTRDRPVSAKSIIASLEHMSLIEARGDQLLGLQIVTAFGYWVMKFKKNNARTKLSHSRWVRLEKYIKMYDFETVLYGIDGAKIHPHMNQEGGKTFHEFEEIFMNKPEGPGRLEKISEYARTRDKKEKHAMLEAHPELEGPIEKEEGDDG